MRLPIVKSLTLLVLGILRDNVKGSVDITFIADILFNIEKSACDVSTFAGRSNFIVTSPLSS